MQINIFYVAGPPHIHTRKVSRIICQCLFENWPDNILTLSVSHTSLNLRILAGISIYRHYLVRTCFQYF